MGADLDKQSKRYVAFLRVLANYRLKKDDACIADGQTAEKGGYSSPNTQKIVQALMSEREDQRTAVQAGLGIGAGLLGLGAAIIGAAVFLTRRRRH
jgi:hypothetical protein